MKETHRGIVTTTEPLNEDQPVTIINRLGQKSLSLPRITNDKRWAGFPGLAGVARKITKIIPKHTRYIEPLAGTAKVYQELKKEAHIWYILNDKSIFIRDWLKKEFPGATVTNTDFVLCVKLFDDKKAFFLFDQPWHQSYYKQKFACFDRKSVKDYDNEILKLCENIQGKFIITTRKENRRMIESGFYNKLLTSDYVVSGRYPQVLLTSNFKIDGR